MSEHRYFSIKDRIQECPGARINVKVNGDYKKIYFHATHEKAIVELFQRATNLWPDAPPEVKWLADVITNGEPMQDYFTNPNLAGKGKPLNADKA
jgi:hypothetical protein